MKKFLLIAIVVAAGLTSCKKDYTCECTTLGLTSSTTINDTKKNAEEACEAGSGTVSGITVECKIK